MEQSPQGTLASMARVFADHARTMMVRSANWRERMGGRIIGGWRPSRSYGGFDGLRAMARRKRQIAAAQLRVHHGPPRILHKLLPGSEAPVLVRSAFRA